jgi:hypothetical protein
MSRISIDQDFLRAALAGFEHRKSEIEARIRELKTELGEAEAAARRRSTGPEHRKGPITGPKYRRSAVAYRKRAVVRRKTKKNGTGSGGPSVTQEVEA